MMPFPYAEIERLIGYTFRDKQLLMTAFTHSSHAKAHGGEDNERLEYLGDAVLGLLIAQWQYSGSKQSEGEMTKQRMRLVCEGALYNTVQSLGLAKFLRYQGGQANVGEKTISSLYETLIGAIYLDGGLQQANEFLLKNFPQAEMQSNYKGKLQEYLQTKGYALPVYQTTKTGKDNAPTFFATVTACEKTGKGTGGDKRSAEQTAAKSLLEILQSENIESIKQ